MFAVRILAVMVAALFFVQLATAGVQRRDTTAADGSDPLASVTEGLRNAAATLQSQFEAMSSSINTTEFRTQLQSFQDRVSEIFNNAAAQLRPTSEPH